jgi:hypothetical protein
MLRNNFDVLGGTGEVMSLSTGTLITLTPYLRIRLLLQIDRLQFLSDIEAYSDNGHVHKQSNDSQI